MLFFEEGDKKTKQNETGGERVDIFLLLFWGVNAGGKIRRGTLLSYRADSCVFEIMNFAT